MEILYVDIPIDASLKGRNAGCVVKGWQPSSGDLLWRKIYILLYIYYRLYSKVQKERNASIIARVNQNDECFDQRDEWWDI